MCRKRQPTNQPKWVCNKATVKGKENYCENLSDIHSQYFYYFCSCVPIFLSFFFFFLKASILKILILIPTTRNFTYLQIYTSCYFLFFLQTKQKSFFLFAYSRYLLYSRNIVINIEIPSLKTWQYEHLNSKNNRNIVIETRLKKMIRDFQPNFNTNKISDYIQITIHNF